MKLTKDPKWLPWSVLALGCVGGALRFLVYRVAVDEKGLLIPMHPVELILWALTAASVCLAVLFTGSDPKKRRDDQLEALCNIKSQKELVADIIALLQSPAKNVISALQGAAGQKIAGLVKTLEERNN